MYKHLIHFGLLCLLVMFLLIVDNGYVSFTMCLLSSICGEFDISTSIDPYLIIVKCLQLFCLVLVIREFSVTHIARLFLQKNYIKYIWIFFKKYTGSCRLKLEPGLTVNRVNRSNSGSNGFYWLTHRPTRLTDSITGSVLSTLHSALTIRLRLCILHSLSPRLEGAFLSLLHQLRIEISNLMSRYLKLSTTRICNCYQRGDIAHVLKTVVADKSMLLYASLQVGITFVRT